MGRYSLAWVPEIVGRFATRLMDFRYSEHPQFGHAGFEYPGMSFLGSRAFYPRSTISRGVWYEFPSGFDMIWGNPVLLRTCTAGFDGRSGGYYFFAL